MSTQGTFHTRTFFYVGGEYVETSNGHVLQNQMYVEKLTPLEITKPHPIIFYSRRCTNWNGKHSICPSPLITNTNSTQNWLKKPDGGKGWASFFLDHGYEIYIIDQLHTGRSPWLPGNEYAQTVASVEYIKEHFTACKNNPLWPQAVKHTQWPGTGMKEDPIFDAFYASQVQFLADSTEQERTMRLAGIALLEKVGPSILITHSRGGLHGWAWADACPTLVKGLIQLEPRGPPFYEAVFSNKFVRPWGLTSIPLTFFPPPSGPPKPPVPRLLRALSDQREDCFVQESPARQLVNLKEIPILIVTGEASYHATYDYATVVFLKQAGCVKVEHLRLEDVDILGNGHMMFLEKNSDEIAKVVEQWIVKIEV